MRPCASTIGYRGTLYSGWRCENDVVSSGERSSGSSSLERSLIEMGGKVCELLVLVLLAVLAGGRLVSLAVYFVCLEGAFVGLDVDSCRIC